MTSEEFISGMRRVVLKGIRERYLENLTTRPRKPEINNQWQRIFRCWDSLDHSQRAAVWELACLAMSESLAGLFSLIDGSSGIKGYPESFQLTYGPTREKLEDLLDYFLNAEQDSPLLEKLPEAFAGGPPPSREELIGIVKTLRTEPEESSRHWELLQRLHQGLRLDVERLRIMVGQESDAEFVVDFAPLMREDLPPLSRAQMIELVEKIERAEGSPSEQAANVQLFDRNCVHPAGLDLLYLSDEYFGEDSEPTPEEIVDKAMGQG